MTNSINKTHYKFDLNFLQKPSVIFILFCVCFSIWYMDLWRSWHYINNDDGPFVYDVANYYAYLPATFTYDYTFKLDNYHELFLQIGPLGGRLPKTTYGMSFFYLPFYAVGYKIAYNTHAPLTGFSEPFATCIHWGSIFYGLLGLVFLRNLIIKFFSEKTTTITLAIIFLGTNLFFYVLSCSEMSHGYLFMLISAFLLCTYRWYQKISIGRSVLLGILIGFISLIRPTDILIGLFFVFWMVSNKQEAAERFKFFMKNYFHLLIMAIVVVLIWTPQFLFWKHTTGRYFFFSYPGERFFWNDPQIINILFSYRKGWFVYTPLILLAFLGLFFMKAEMRKLRGLIAFVILVIIYVLSCWWDWFFGGGFGGRPFVQYYSFLAIPIAALVAHILENLQEIKLRPAIQTLFYGIVFSGIFLNIGQTYQYNAGLIHYCSMSKESYWTVFGKYKLNENETKTFWKSLREPDYDKLKSGEDRDQ